MLAFGSGCPQLRLGTNTDQLLPVCVGRRDFFGALIILVATGECHATAVAADGLMHTWGKGGHGQLGHGDLEVRSRLTLLGKELFARSPAAQVTCGLRTLL